MFRNALFFASLLSVFALTASACSGNDVKKAEKTAAQITMGTLPPQTPQLLAEEFEIYKKLHPEMDEASARKSFDTIQLMSAEHSDPFVASWAERRALAQRWLKARIEDVYAPETVTDEFAQSAIDAYAFKSGHPALVTASHILIRPDAISTPEQRKAALNAIRTQLLSKNNITDDDLREAAHKLTRYGYRSDMNANLTFPRHPMTSFMDEQLEYKPVVEPFAAAAFALSPDNRLSDVVESEFGYHLILFKSRTEEKKATLANDRDFIVSNIVAHGRQIAVRQILEETMQAGDIRVDEKRLAEIAK